ncbi:hypothetical protein HOD29_03805 [archaeon]|jgi:hypothetical protein|nr:hypothetical protein [archaeon]
MRPEIKKEEFEDDRKKWKIYFDLDDVSERNQSTILIRFNPTKYPLTEKNIENLKQDLKDLGKFRIIKQGKEFLGE